ncbi:MAG: hypothetical protein Q4C23_02115 [Mycoplasmatota bacterium]|nr:hypothetical protein [Mycoplasmatota bacterium]
MSFLAVSCEPLMPFIRLIRDGLIPVIQIGIPIILIVLGMLDLGKAVVASKEDEIKAAQKLLVKRAIYAVAIFFVVFAVNAVFSLLAGTTGEDSIDKATVKWSDCWFNKK